MRYCTWRLLWIDGNGYSPQQRAIELGGKLTPTKWCDKDLTTGKILGFIEEDVDLSLLADWEVTEVNEFEARDFVERIEKDKMGDW
jgi:hypothetical protein